MTNDEYQRLRAQKAAGNGASPVSAGVGSRASALPDGGLIATTEQLAEFLPRLQPFDRIAIDTEADSLHSYFEKLCLLQLSIPGEDFLIDTLAGFDLVPLAQALNGKEIVLQGADFDLRLMRRSFGFVASRVFDTVVAARMLGIRAFSLQALVEQFFGVKLTKGSQKANWAQRPLPRHMAEYAVNDTRYLLPLAEKMENDLRAKGRLEWFWQSCQRGLEVANIERERDEEEAWRITGSGLLRGQAAAILRSLWRWRDGEARAADRPPFHILQNHQLLSATERVLAGEQPEFRHLSPRRQRGLHESAAAALQLPESEWPVKQRRVGARPTREMERRAIALRRTRDKAAAELGIEEAFIASRATLEAIAMDEARSLELLVPWQRALLDLSAELVGSPSAEQVV